MFVWILLLCFATAVNTVPIFESNQASLDEDVLPKVPLTPLESEMLERKKRCNDCNTIGFILIISSVENAKSEPEIVSDFIPLSKFPLKENPTSNDRAIKYFHPFTSKDLSDTLANELLQWEERFNNKKIVKRDLSKKESNNLVREDQESMIDKKSEHNCTFSNNLKNITGLEFPGEPFAIICIDNYDKLGFCGPIDEIMFDCRGIPTKEGKYSCCLEKFIYKFLPSFDKIYDSVTKLSSEIKSSNQQQVYVPLYPITN